MHLAGGGAPTAQVTAKIHEALAPAMAQAGLEFAQSLERADYVLTATFTPDPVNEEGGRLTLQSLEPARPWRRGPGNPAAATLREMQDRVDNLERWGMRAQVGR